MKEPRPIERDRGAIFDFLFGQPMHAASAQRIEQATGIPAERIKVLARHEWFCRFRGPRLMIGIRSAAGRWLSSRNRSADENQKLHSQQSRSLL